MFKAFLSNFNGKLMEIIGSKPPGDYSAPFGLIFFDLLMGESEIPHFYDFGIFGCVTEPQNQLFLSFETPEYLTKSRRTPGTFFKILSL